jgi:4,5-DOPA dioxygenase extradiol
MSWRIDESQTDPQAIVAASQALRRVGNLALFWRDSMNRLPTLFISHGSPMLAIEDSPARQFLQQLGKSLPRPKAILVASAHWESVGAPAVSLAEQPETIHDFGGFPRALFEIAYPAPGAPAVAERAADLLERAGYSVKRSPNRGLDHGAWVPLRLMYPDADIPVLQLSLLRGATPTAHEKLGNALSALRDEGVMVIGSGSLTHNLYEFRGQGIDAPVPAWVSDFGTWMNTQLHDRQRDALLDYRRQAPHAERNHPTEEHLLPLFVAMGAAGDDAKAERIHASFEHGVLAMDVYAFS